MSDANWWACPNDPPCPHGAVVHDVYDADDPLPTCCMVTCDCGHDPVRRAELRREQEEAGRAAD